jgi:hypothetical protein
MPSKHSDETQAVTWRFDKPFVARLRAVAAAQGGPKQGKVWVRQVLEAAVVEAEQKAQQPEG